MIEMICSFSVSVFDLILPVHAVQLPDRKWRHFEILLQLEGQNFLSNWCGILSDSILAHYMTRLHKCFIESMISADILPSKWVQMANNMPKINFIRVFSLVFFQIDLYYSCKNATVMKLVKIEHIIGKWKLFESKF